MTRRWPTAADWTQALGEIAALTAVVGRLAARLDLLERRDGGSV
jgi:hypothetical protein